MALSRCSKAALHLSVFLSCISFAIVMPSLWPYLYRLHASEPFLARVVAIYSVGEAAGALFFGHLSATVPARAAMLYATALGLAGSVLYIVAQPFPGRTGPVVVLLARLMQGLWTGATQAIQTAYLARILPSRALTPAIVALNAYACMGFVAGPIFGLVFDVLPPLPLVGPLQIDQLTGPGYFVMLSAVVCLILFAVVFDEQADCADVSPLGNQPASPISADREEVAPLLTKHDTSTAPDERHGPRLVTLPLVLCNLVFFVHFYSFALQETMTTPYVQTFYAWSVLRANLLFTGAGVLALITFMALSPMSRVCSDRGLTMGSLGLGAVGYALLTGRGALPVWRFLAGFAVISVAFPVGRATTIGLYAKLLPAHVQGVGQGIILAVGAMARIVGPFWAVRSVGPAGGLEVFGSTAGLFAACLVGMGLAYPQLRV